MLVIGLTGGIASGKTAAGRRFESLGVPVIDADRLARELVAPGRPALHEIQRTFGRGVLTAAGELDRTALRTRIFSDHDARRRLEAILHPKIRAAMEAQIARLEAPYVVLVIPLLLETGQTDLVDRILVIDVPEDLQRARLMARDGSDSLEVERILASQVSRQRRWAAADDLIDNSADLRALEQSVLDLHHKYLTLAGPAGNSPLPTHPR